MKTITVLALFVWACFGSPAFASDGIDVSTASWAGEDGNHLDATSFLQQVCNGHSACDLGRIPMNAVIGDPSPGVPKQLDITYSCIAGQDQVGHSVTFYEVLASGSVDAAFYCTES